MTRWRFRLRWDDMELDGVLVQGDGGPMSAQWTPAAIMWRVRRLAFAHRDLLVWLEWSAAGGVAIHVPAAECEVVGMWMEAGL